MCVVRETEIVSVGLCALSITLVDNSPNGSLFIHVHVL